MSMRNVGPDDSWRFYKAFVVGLVLGMLAWYAIIWYAIYVWRKWA